MQEKNFGMRDKRIEWLDVSRGILIILMVVGHSTGLFNKYIYQFHMAAFFFLSGYVANLEGKGFFRTLFDKFFTVLLPAVATVLLGLCILWLLHFGHYDVLLSTWEFPGWEQALTSFFVHGDIYVDVLGANWFLITLFGVCILNKIIYLLAHKSSEISIFFSLVLYVTGYEMIKTVDLLHIGMFYMDLIFIGNLFYTIGFFIRKKKIFEWVEKSKAAVGVIFLISIVGSILNRYYLHVMVDWPSHRFGHSVLDGISAMNGIVLVFTASLIINRFLKKCGKLLGYIGKNTMGVLFFHFMFFKVMYLPFYWLGIIGKEDLSCTVPGRMSTSVLEKNYWSIIALGAIVLSLLTWRTLLISKPLEFLLGQNKHVYNNIWNVFYNTKFYSAMAKFILKSSIKIKEYVHWMENNAKRIKSLHIIMATLLLLSVVPLYKQGIMCNDELQSRLWSMGGFSQFYTHYAEEYVSKGRALSILIDPLTMYMGFLGCNNWTFKVIQIFSILLDAGLFAIFLGKLLHNKKFAVVCGLSIVTFLPITFEHTAPNAFNILFNIPFLFLLLSLILFTNYLDNGRKGEIIFSMLFLFLNLVSYESFIMLVPLYWGIVVYKTGLRDKKSFLKRSFYPSLTALIFLVFYLISGTIFQSSYVGNQIGRFSLKSSLKIIWQLVQSAFPGYWIFTSKYKYLASYYNELNIENYIRIIFVIVLCGKIVYFLMPKEKECESSVKNFWAILGMGILCIILPILPISISKMYQGHVGADGFMALPTTFFCYFGATFVCWLIIWRLCNKVHTRYFTLCVTTAVMCCLLPIQAMNDIFAEQQKKDFQRLTNIESLFSTDLFNRLEEKQFLSTDIFVVRNALAIHDSYWTEYADINDSSVEILKRTPTTKDRRIYFDDNKFTLWCGNEVCIITNELKEDCEIIQYSENEFMIAKYQNPVCDQGLYEYYYTLSNTGKLISSNRDNFLIESAGSSLKDCIKVNGFYEDGWIGPKSQFIIKTGNEGIVEIEIYCPLDDFSDKEITVYVDGAFAETVKIQEIRQKFSVCAAPYQTIELKLESNFVQKSTSLDIRELATIIMSMEGK